MLLKDLQTLATKLATGTLFHVEKAGKAYSVDYSALAKAIIEEYADSTVGGSKQSVQAAIGALNSRIPQFVNGINQWNGFFIQGSLSGQGEDTNAYTRLRSSFVRVVPSSTYYMSVDEQSDTNIIIYEIHYYKPDKTWIKLTSHSKRAMTFDVPSDCAYIKFLLRKYDNTVIAVNEVDASKIMLNISDSAIDGTYSAYEGFANQSDVDTLKSRTFWRNQIADVTISANSDTVLTLTKSTKAFMFIASANKDVCGVFICSSTSTNSNVAFLPVLLGSALSLSADGNQLIITNSSASVAYAYGFIVDGSGITA